MISFPCTQGPLQKILVAGWLITIWESFFAIEAKLIRRWLIIARLSHYGQVMRKPTITLDACCLRKAKSMMRSLITKQRWPLILLTRKRTTILASRYFKAGALMMRSLITRRHWRFDRTTPIRRAIWRTRFFPRAT